MYSKKCLLSSTVAHLFHKSKDILNVSILLKSGQSKNYRGLSTKLFNSALSIIICLELLIRKLNWVLWCVVEGTEFENRK